MPKKPSLPIKKLPNGKWEIYIPPSMTAQGKRRRPSFKTKSEATRFRESILRGQEMVGGNSLASAADLEDLTRAKRTLSQAGLDPAPSMQELARHWISTKSRTTTTVGQLFERYWSERGEYRSDATQTDLRLFLSRIEEQLGSDADIGDITRQTLTDAIENAFAPTNSRWNKIRRTIGPVFTFAVRHELLKESPVVKLVQREHEKAATIIYTIEQAQRLLDACSDDVLPYYALALFAGIRPVELSKLLWSDINLDKRRIIVRANVSKTRKNRRVDIPDNLASILEGLRGSGEVAPTKNLRKLCEAPRKQAGLIGMGNDISRHSFASYHLAAHDDMSLLKRNMGHETQDITLNHYVDVLTDPDDAMRYWEMIPSPSSNG